MGVGGRERGFVQCGQGGGVSLEWTSAVFGAKNFEFFDIYSVSRTDKGGKEESIFRDFVRTSFMDGP